MGSALTDYYSNQREDRKRAAEAQFNKRIRSLVEYELEPYSSFLKIS